MLKPVFKSACLILWTALWYPPVALAKKMGKTEQHYKMIMLCNKGMLFICGIRVTVQGNPAQVKPLLVVSNHISYLDVVLLGSQMPIRFTPKSDIAGWPLIGHISRVCDAVFIDRKPDKIKDMKNNLHQALGQGKIISLFPEGTTGDGVHLEPFKSGFFALAEEKFGEETLTIQPVAITYTHIRSLPIDRTQWPSIAWYGDMELLSHLFHVLSIGPIDAELVFLPPVRVEGGQDRKTLAAQCQKQIEQVIEDIRSRPARVNKPKEAIKAAPVLKIGAKK